MPNGCPSGVNSSPNDNGFPGIGSLNWGAAFSSKMFFVERRELKFITLFLNVVGNLSSSSGTLQFTTGKVLAGAISLSAVLKFLVGKLLVGATALSGTLQCVVGKIVAGTITSVGILLKRI